MRRLIESTIVSLDGVIEAPERWAGFDAEATELAMRELARYDAFVMGRVTYEKFYAHSQATLAQRPVRSRARDRYINQFRKRTAMRKLIESTLVSLDGVTEAPERWASFDAEDAALSLEQLGNYDAFVMGRVTYEKFYATWGRVVGDPYIDRISATPKYVASRSLTQTAWNATLLGPDPSGAIARLKDQPGKDLIKYGTSRLDDTLVRDHLIDEFHLWIRPVVAGAGRRLFEDVDTAGLDLRLTDERKLENGSVILTYAPG